MGGVDGEGQYPGGSSKVARRDVGDDGQVQEDSGQGSNVVR
jgi:hypothetical protein